MGRIWGSVQVPMEARESIRCPGAGVMGGCELPCVELGSSAGAASVLSHWAISPAPNICTFYPHIVKRFFFSPLDCHQPDSALYLTVKHRVIPELGNLRLKKKCKLEASLGYTKRPCLKKKKKCAQQNRMGSQACYLAYWRPYIQSLVLMNEWTKYINA